MDRSGGGSGHSTGDDDSKGDGCGDMDDGVREPTAGDSALEIVTAAEHGAQEHGGTIDDTAAEPSNGGSVSECANMGSESERVLTCSALAEATNTNICNESKGSTRAPDDGIRHPFLRNQNQEKTQKDHSEEASQDTVSANEMTILAVGLSPKGGILMA